MDGGSAPCGDRFAMKTLLGNRFLVMGLRLFVGLAFAVAGVEKIADPAVFGISIANYRILPGPLVLVPATVLPWMELLCGLCLLFGVLVRGSSLLVASMLVVFVGAVLSAVVRGLDISCGCFTPGPGAAAVGWSKILENLGLLCASLVLLYTGEGPWSLGRYLRKGSG
jgi:putative oxidoreductase